MHGDEISPAAATSDGPRLLREFLLYAEHGRLESNLAGRLGDTESPFEREVLGELTRRGIKALPQIGVAGYRIDIGIMDDDVPGRFVCGVECDGAAYHSSESARDRDRLRNQVLEGRGWTLIRVWSTDWFKDRVGQIERLLKRIENARAVAKAETVANQKARQQASVRSDARATPNHSTQPAADGQETSPPQGAAGPSFGEYQRPSAQPYVITPGDGRFAGRDILEVDESALSNAIQAVIEVETPIHIAELMTRVAGMWGNRAGSRIQTRIQDVASRLVGNGIVRRRGEFFWTTSDSCPVRSRAQTKIPADRIAPEEFENAVLAVLAGGHRLPRPVLTAEVRSVLGYSRTGAIIEEAVSDAISRLLASGYLGEGSTGLALRTVKA